jgi:pSer/pThr/pTyr-binding forkhead associated (FHA) protein
MTLTGGLTCLAVQSVEGFAFRERAMNLRLAIVGGKQAGTEIPIRKPQFLIGRGDGCHLRPQTSLVSRKHCAITVEAGLVALEDFGSTNGTFLNDERIEQRCTLKNGDRIKVGALELEVRFDVPAEVKKKISMHPAHEHVRRSIAATSKMDDDLEISSWLAEESDDPRESSSAKKQAGLSTPLAFHDTIAGKPSDETTTSMPTDRSLPKIDEKKPAVKVPGQFKRPPKPMAESSRSAAEDMLRQFFPRKKP